MLFSVSILYGAVFVSAFGLALKNCAGTRIISKKIWNMFVRLIFILMPKKSIIFWV